MKKFIPFLSFLFLIAIVYPSYSQQVSEGFEKQYFPPSGWKSVNLSGYSWKTSVVNPKSGLKSAFIANQDNKNGSLGQGDNWLILPKIYNVKSTDKLNFSIAAQFNDPLNINQGYFDKLQVYVSTSDDQISSFTNLLGEYSSDGFSLSYVSYALSLTPYAGQNIYIAFRNFQSYGNGWYLDDVSAGSALPTDVGSMNINLKGDAIYATGATINITDTIKNYGTTALPTGIPVKYTVNGGSPVTLATTSALSSGATTYVEFKNSDAFVPTLPGKYLLKIFTDYPSEVNRANDTIIHEITVQTPISSFPYFQDFQSPGDWTLAGSNYFSYKNSLNLAGVNHNLVNPAGDNDNAAVAITYVSYDEDFILRSPLLNLTGISKPMLNFYVAAGRIDNTFYDGLQVLVSTDGGLTYDAPPLYNKSQVTSSKLVTVDPDPNYLYIPENVSDWRHEIVDLSKYAGNPNVIVAFKVHSGGGNNVWIDNVNIISQPALYYNAAKVTTAGQTVTGAFNTQVKFNTVPVADSIRIEGNNVIPFNNVFDPNSTATAPGGAIETPNFVLARYFTIAYSGNSLPLNRANYDISMDISGMSGFSPADIDRMYILKRADESDAWTALSTTRSGNILKASSLNRFSDFAIGYFSTAVPVTVLSFDANRKDNKIVLQWNTSQEANITSYEVQRWDGASWQVLGSVNSLRSSMQNQYTFDDNYPQPGLNLYRLRIVSEIGSSAYSDVAKAMFESFVNKVYQNVPNPFRNQTLIRFDVGKTSKVQVIVYGVTGKQIAVLENSIKPAGTYQVNWQAGNLPAGTYFYKVIIDDEVQTRSMLKVY